MDIFRIELRPVSKRSMFMQILSSRFEMKIQFQDLAARSRFLRQCEELTLLECIDPWSSFTTNKKTNQKQKSIMSIISQLFCGGWHVLWKICSKKRNQKCYYEPVMSPFERS